MKKEKAGIVLLLVGILIGSLYAAASLESRTGEILPQVESILKQVQEIRGLTFKEPPRIVVISKTEAMEMWKPGKPDMVRLRREEMIYKMTLLLPPDYQYIREKREISTGWMAATVGNTIYIIRENFNVDPATARRAIAHESVHVLQKQWFNARYGSNTSDGTLAVKALVEGDADLVADIYCQRNGIPIHKITSFSGKPLTDLNIFPYVLGDRFVRYLYERGGWKLVNAAYTRYPDSSLEVMEPELYRENFTPVRVTLSAPPEAKILWRDRLGAFYAYVLMRDVAKLDNETAWNASTAWRGDELLLMQENASYVLVWKVVFSDSSHAREFAEVLEGLTKRDDYAVWTIRIDGNTVTLKAVRGEFNET